MDKRVASDLEGAVSPTRLARLRTRLTSRWSLGGAYALACILTGVAVWMASSAPVAGLAQRRGKVGEAAIDRRRAADAAQLGGLNPRLVGHRHHGERDVAALKERGDLLDHLDAARGIGGAVRADEAGTRCGAWPDS